MSSRIEKVNSLLQHEIGKIIARDFNFPEALVTLTHMDTSANLIETRGYISVLPEEKTDAIVTVLNKGVYDVQQKINKMVNMRPVPKIKFVRDKEILEAAKIEAILEELKKEEK